MPGSSEVRITRTLRRIADAIDAGQVAVTGCHVKHTDQPQPIHEQPAGIDRQGVVSLTYEGPADVMAGILAKPNP